MKELEEESESQKKRIEDLERTLKVIRTWAMCHEEYNTLEAEDVVKKCDAVL
jgi:hypothetical protein